MLELPILGLLKEEPLHGYELKKRLDETLGAVSGVSYGSLYPALRRLEKAQAIEAVEPAGPAAPMPPTGSIGGETAAARMRRRLKPTRRKRKEYRITARGHDLLHELLRTGEDASDDRAFVLKLTFCRYLERADRLELFERRRAWLSEKLARVRTALAGDGSGASGSSETPRRKHDLYTRSLMEHDREATAREMEWVESLIASERGVEKTTEPSGSASDPTTEQAVAAGSEGGTTT